MIDYLYDLNYRSKALVSYPVVYSALDFVLFEVCLAPFEVQVYCLPWLEPFYKYILLLPCVFWQVQKRKGKNWEWKTLRKKCSFI